VLTDVHFFGGSTQDLQIARLYNPTTPILRKDFVIDEYQIHEAKAMGADVILLIAACLTPEQSHHLAQVAHQLGLEVLLEVHDLAELQAHQNIGADLIGVNNRNLKTFEVNLNISAELAPHIPEKAIKVAESGIYQHQEMQWLKQVGFQGFLIGESFMKTANPEKALAEFLEPVAL
jgi:indole-3-glycerol phosphate synthase